MSGRCKPSIHPSRGQVAGTSRPQKIFGFCFHALWVLKLILLFVTYLKLWRHLVKISLTCWKSCERLIVRHFRPLHTKKSAAKVKYEINVKTESTEKQVQWFYNEFLHHWGLHEFPILTSMWVGGHLVVKGRQWTLSCIWGKNGSAYKNIESINVV